MVEKRATPGPKSSQLFQEALIRKAKAHHTPEAARLAALAARLEPQLQAFEANQNKLQVARSQARRPVLALGFALPTLAAALIPCLYFNNGLLPVLPRTAEPTSVISGLTAPAPVIPSTEQVWPTPDLSELSDPIPPLPVSGAHTPEPVTTHENTAVRASYATGNRRSKGATPSPSPEAVSAVTELALAQPPFGIVAPSELVAAVSPPAVQPKRQESTVIAAPPGRYAAMQALAVHGDMVPRHPEVQVHKTTARTQSSPSELSPRMSAAASTVAPWML